MRVPRIPAILALFLLLPVLVAAGPRYHAMPETSLTITLHLADGTKPMANVPVTVYYRPFNPPTRYKLQIMAQATTNSSGQLSTILNTTMVPKTGLADVGTGPDAFNAEVIAIAPSRQIVDAPQVLRLGHTNTVRASAITNPDTGKPELADEVRAAPGFPANSAAQIASSYRYIPVLALNDAPGMRATFTYTFDASTSKQTTAGTALALNAGDAGFGPFSASSSTTESTDRSLTRHVYETGNYHKIIWADYKWIEDAELVGCGKGGCAAATHTWSLSHWQGSIGQFNPNTACIRSVHRKGRKICKKKAIVGIVHYAPPKFRSSQCASNFCLTTLRRNSPDLTRNTVQTQTYDFQLDVAGFLGLDSQSAYGSITSVTWYWTKRGCNGNKSRVLWGYKSDPITAPILQASCMKVPRS
jgi:hypothetical protein